MKNSLAPNPSAQINKFSQLARDRIPFTFVRFSDGEVEILRNRKLVIQNGRTEFRGRLFSNKFPVYDEKNFNPDRDHLIRFHLMESATYSAINYFKGIRTQNKVDHTAINDREFLLRLNSGFNDDMTFSDLFINENYLNSRQLFFPSLINEFSNLYVVGNWRCNLKGYLSGGKLFPIPDNFFSNYQEVLRENLSSLRKIPDYSLVLSSASSLSNVLGFKLKKIRPDITFIDIGTALNDLIGLAHNSREYHKLLDQNFFIRKMQRWGLINRKFALKW